MPQLQFPNLKTIKTQKSRGRVNDVIKFLNSQHGRITNTETPEICAHKDASSKQSSYFVQSRDLDLPDLPDKQELNADCGAPLEARNQ